MLYGGRSPEELLYTAELERWRGRFDVRGARSTVDQAGRGWHGRVGVVTTLVAARRRSTPTTPWR